MRCPECNNVMLCFCKACGNNRKVAEFVDGDIIACSNCGHEGHADYWLDVEWKQHMDRCPVCKRSKPRTAIICDRCMDRLQERRLSKE